MAVILIVRVPNPLAAEDDLNPEGAERSVPDATGQRARGDALASQTGCRYYPAPTSWRLAPAVRTCGAPPSPRRNGLDNHFHEVGTSPQSRPTVHMAGVVAEVAIVQTSKDASSRSRKIRTCTLGNMRSQGCRELLAYCKSDGCKHGAIVSVGHLPDGTPIRLLGDGVVCSRCGHIGANVLPN